jgi:hypothetical protein
MTTKADFSAEEWERVLLGPPAAGLLVVLAARGGTLRESLSIARAYAEARQGGGESELLDQIVAAQPPLQPQAERSPEELRERLLRELREAVEALAARATPEEVAAYRAFVMRVAEGTAEAHKEGGFLGIGGTRVSEEERRRLEEIRGLLDGAAPA